MIMLSLLLIYRSLAGAQGLGQQVWVNPRLCEEQTEKTADGQHGHVVPSEANFADQAMWMMGCFSTKHLAPQSRLTLS